MSGINSFRVFLFEKRTIYLPGAVIEGAVILYNTAAFEARGIRLKFKCNEKTRWTVRSRVCSLNDFGIDNSFFSCKEHDSHSGVENSHCILNFIRGIESTSGQKNDTLGEF